MAEISITADLLQRACDLSGFPVPAGELIFFGIRGALPDSAASTGFSHSQMLRFTEIDYNNMRCTLGQWNQAEGTIAAFSGSTVPSLPNIARAKERGGSGANLLIPGRYEYERGPHKPGKPSGHRAFRQARFFPVRRTRNNTSYDVFDDIDFGADSQDYVWDNLHSAYSATTERYSSAGCQVICGQPSSPDRGNRAETGPWRDFINVAYSHFGEQRSYAYLLFTAEELSVIATSAPTKQHQVVRYGSVGPAARLVQEALIAKGDLAGKADGDFGRKSLMALVAFQSRTFPRNVVDGICGPNTANALGITLPSHGGAAVALEGLRAEPATVPEIDLDDETDMAPGEADRLLGLLGLGQVPGQAPTAVSTPAAPDPVFSLDTFVRTVSGHPFQGVPEKSQVDGMSEVMRAFFRHYPDGDRRWLAYILATIFHETGGRMLPVREGFATSDASARAVVKKMFTQGRIKSDYAAPDPVTGLSYFGRGRVQTTHKSNYATLSTRFDRDFVNQPNLLLDSAIDAEVAVIGHVEGLWTRKKLSAFIDGGRCDYRGARAIVNGTDRADDIADYARQFEDAIDAALALNTGTMRIMVPPQVPEGVEESIRGGTSVREDIFAGFLERLRMAESRLGITNSTASSDSQSLDDRLNQIDAAMAALPAATAALTPVNAALGEGIGRLLNGKKSVIGIGGALLASISANGGDNVQKIVGAINEALPFLAGMSGTALPVFTGVAAWGLLGKIEKMIMRNRP